MREISVNLKHPITISKITLKIDRNVLLRYVASLMEKRNLRRMKDFQAKDFQADDFRALMAKLVPADQLREEVTGEIDVEDDFNFIMKLVEVMLEDVIGTRKKQPKSKKKK